MGRIVESPSDLSKSCDETYYQYRMVRSEGIPRLAARYSHAPEKIRLERYSDTRKALRPGSNRLNNKFGGTRGPHLAFDAVCSSPKNPSTVIVSVGIARGVPRYRFGEPGRHRVATVNRLGRSMIWSQSRIVFRRVLQNRRRSANYLLYERKTLLVYRMRSHTKTSNWPNSA